MVANFLPTAHNTNTVEETREDDTTTDDMYSQVSSRHDNPGGRTDSDRKKRFATRESAFVIRLKVLVITVLVVSTIVVSLMVHKYTSNAEEEEFEKQFREDSTKVLATLGTKIDLIMQAMDSLSVSMASYAKDTDQTWPFVVIPDFAVRAEKVRSLTGAVYINMYQYIDVHQRDEWEHFTSIPENYQWVNETLDLMEEKPRNPWPIVRDYDTWNVIHGYDGFLKDEPGFQGTNQTGPWLPMWQTQPVIPYDPPFNWDLNSVYNTSASDVLFETHKVTLSQAYLIHDPNASPEAIQGDYDEAEWLSDYLTTDEDPMEPISDFYMPVLDIGMAKFDLGEGYDKESSNVVAILSLSVYWRDALKDILPQGAEGVRAVFMNACCPTFTYEINGASVKFLGMGDIHQKEYDRLGVTSPLNDLRRYSVRESSYSGRPLNGDFCPFTVSIYPSGKMEGTYTTKTPIYFTLGAVFIFSFTSFIFVLYDSTVERRHHVVKTRAAKSSTIVNSLFPEAVQERVAEEVLPGGKGTPDRSVLGVFGLPANLYGKEHHAINGTPIAELFPQTTVLFADIVGFTAWSSVRDPSQVFTLLETIYAGFDEIAKSLNVFKVETIGDCYVAVVGLPTPNPDHAVVMSNFAHCCREKMRNVVSRLEADLGPGTAALSARIGLHSGPTTAGVLRGEKARFQLFGDTMNMASRMESTGVPNHIQVSAKTAEILRKSKKGHWLTKRSDLVNVKGKGRLQTYFIDPVRGAGSSMELVIADVGVPSSPTDPTKSKLSALIDWNSSVLEGLLEEVAAHRSRCGREVQNGVSWSRSTSRVIEEVSNDTKFPESHSSSIPCHQAPTTFLSEEAKHQLRDYVSQVAGMYPEENCFHNFDHASHVVMSVVKLLQRISSRVSTTDHPGDQKCSDECVGVIASDPMAKFAMAFAALIHDVNHPGVSNKQLVEENSELAEFYGGRCIAEQNSVDLAWDLLMESTYSDLRAAIYSNDDELVHFRKIVVNSVIATDLFDEEMKERRAARWEKAFKDETTEDKVNSRALLVIEYMMQASNVAHTMQHWNVYQQWNTKLFREHHVAFKTGRTAKDPAETWFDDELKFFDDVVLPLAGKMKESEVFGSGGEESWDLAKENRLEWETKGSEIVEGLRADAEMNIGMDLVSS